MKRFQTLAFVAAALLCSVSCHAADGWITVKGNKFIDPQGNELILRGLCFPDPVKLVREGQWNEWYFAEAAGWGANVVRFAVHPSNLNSYGWEDTFLAMDQGIEWAKRFGMYVIMDWHSIGNLKDERYTSRMYNTTQEETFKFWRTVAQRYKDEPAVALYELFNEPTVTAPKSASASPMNRGRMYPSSRRKSMASTSPHTSSRKASPSPSGVSTPDGHPC